MENISKKSNNLGMFYKEPRLEFDTAMVNSRRTFLPEILCL
jgi:hypothetical protein